MLPTTRLEYDLPQELIATEPAAPRDAARLLVVSRSDASRMEFGFVRDLPALLSPDDLLMVNASRVVPARLVGVRRATGAKVEGLWLAAPTSGQWVTLLRANGRLRTGDLIDLRPAHAHGGAWTLRLAERVGRGWLASVERQSGLPGATVSASFDAVLEDVGLTPIPPYIRAARQRSGVTVREAVDRTGYQTVYAHSEEIDSLLASVAAPTAGLHFTPDLLAQLTRLGVARAEVTLGVGSGTFQPIETAHVEEHPMHEEWMFVGEDAQRIIAAKRAAGGRVVAVGTTAARALESLPKIENGGGVKQLGALEATRILIAPGHTWRNVDALLTNFHLPRSTLLAMVASLFPQGVDRLLDIYHEAIKSKMRFYSYGDAMLILP